MEMPPNNLRRLTAEFIDFIRFALNRLRKLFYGSSYGEREKAGASRKGRN
jgi:hypothetical protein